MPHKDPEVRRAYQREYSQRHSARKTARAAAWNKANPERRRAIKIKHRFGITGEEYDRLLETQGGMCALCGQPETVSHNGQTPSMLAVDHDHETGAVRGLLCFRCNVGLGHLDGLLEKAMQYVTRYRSE